MGWLTTAALVFTAYKLGTGRVVAAGTPSNPTLQTMLTQLVQQGKLTPADAEAIMRSAATGVIESASIFTAVANLL
jgi:hypothetical protein